MRRVSLVPRARERRRTVWAPLARISPNSASVRSGVRRMARLADGTNKYAPRFSTSAIGDIPRLSSNSVKIDSSVASDSIGSMMSSICWRTSSGSVTISFHGLKLLSPTLYDRKPRSNGFSRSASLSAKSVRILAPARRMRSRAMSAILA